MAASVTCPDCAARLELPMLPIGQSVQCRRCARVFDPNVPPNGPDVERVTEEVHVKSILLGLPQPPMGTWKTPGAITTLAILLLVCLFELYVHYEQYFLIHREREAAMARLRIRLGRRVILPGIANRHALAEERSSWASKHDLAQNLLSATFPIALFFFMAWLHQASCHARSLHAEGLTFQPMAVLLTLIPLVNVVVVYFMMQEIWRASNPETTRDPRNWREGPRSCLIRVWCACFLVPILLRGVYVTTEAHLVDFADEARAALLMCAALGFVAVGIALTIYAVIAIGARQNARYERLMDEFDDDLQP